ncbi:hypothetical protein M3Y95_00850200 [Aphelenchoides besseyi]|nr:hypothetical protein M3Y95_00850200 [Aphelenchoides besseyi]
MHFPKLSEIVVVLILIYFLRSLKWICQVLHDICRQLKHTKNIGGPTALPLIGSAHHFMSRSSYDTIQYLLDEAKKVTDAGGSMMKIWIGPKMDIWILNADSAKDILGSLTEITKGPAYEFFSRWLGKGTLIAKGDQWRKMRKMVTPTFHFGKIEEYAQTMDYHTRIMIDLLNKKPTNSQIDLYPLIKHCALDIIADTAMCYKMNSQTEEDTMYLKAVEEWSHLGWIQFQNPHYQMFGGFLWKLLGHEAKTVRTLKTLKSFTRNIVQERIEMLGSDLKNGHMEEKRNQNFLDMMLEHQSENHLTMNELCTEVDTFIFAVSWVMWCLATHKDVQEKLYQEIRTEFGCSDVEFWTKRIQELPYLDCCFKESNRLFPPVPFVQRRLENDLVIDNQLIPRHTCILIPPCIMHMNEKVFPNPTHYDPDRFASGKQFDAYSYIPFLAGPRNCVGQAFAKRNARIMIAHLVFNFELSSDYKFEDNLPIPESITQPSIGVPVKLKPRNL